MSAFYPPQLLLLPVRVQHRLPPALQSVDLEATLVLHTLLSLFASVFKWHMTYALPLSLFGLVAVSSSLSATLLPHFLLFWIVSFPMDIVWLLYRANKARLIVIAVMGANMVFKLVSAGQAAKVLQSLGALPEVGGYSSMGGSGAAWLGSQQGGQGGQGEAPFGLPGSWTGRPGKTQAPYTDARSAEEGYQSVYADQDLAVESDAPTVRVDHIASNLSMAKEGPGGRSKRGDYQSIE